MKLLKVDKTSVNMEIKFDELGILHFALYDYLMKVEARMEQKGRNEKKTLKLIDKIKSMVETVNTLI